MHVRINTVRSGKKTYRYTQLVQSRRRDDGKTTQVVISNLGELTPLATENIRLALEASRNNRAIVLAHSPVQKSDSGLKVRENLRYLDVAVLLEMWSHWGLTEVLKELMPIGDAVVEPALIVCALSLQRCVSPTSKSEAPKWFAQTALPELLNLAPVNFNNTRLHRVLDELDRVGPTLMRKLPRLYQDRQGAFAALFVDVTDSWFVGHGPGIAEKAKTKEGRFERKVNILLLCNEHGYPIRWETFSGRDHDSESMLKLFESIRGLSWVGKGPVVCDRALGSTSHLRRLLATEVPFLTAMTKTEIGSYAQVVASKALADFALPDRDEPNKKELKEAAVRAAKLAREAGMDQVDESLLVSDFGVVTQTKAKADRRESQSTNNEVHKTVRAMGLARKLRSDLDEGRATTYSGAGKPYNLTKRQVCRFLQLMNLTAELQEAILGGEASVLSENDLIRIAQLNEPDEQQAEFARLVEHRTTRPDGRTHRVVTPSPEPKARIQPQGALKVRTVLYFNPEMFVHQRLQARKTLSEIDAFIKEQNLALSKPQSRRKPTAITADILLELRKRDLASVYAINIRPRTIEGKKRYQIDLSLKAEAWEARRALDGFSLLVGHPDLPHSAEELCTYYRAKNAVEHDFRVIKSVVKLRPFHHRLDSKIRAHVSICMLSLLLERTLDRKLKTVRAAYTSSSALACLESCRLNRYGGADGVPSFYTTTITTPEQNAVLRALRRKHLADDKEIADLIMPR
jgi:transposase